MARLRGRAPCGERCRAGVPHGHVWTPRRMQEKSSVQAAARDRVLPCVRPLIAAFMTAGPYGSSRIRSTSLERARSAPRAPGSPDPASPTLRHTCPSTFSRPPDSLDRFPHSGGDGRSLVVSTLRHQSPGDARCLVGQRHNHEHRRLAGKHPMEPRTGGHPFLPGPAVARQSG